MNKICTKCATSKLLTEFHKSAKASDGCASWCRTCVNAISRSGRRRTYSSENKRKWQLSTRYGLTPEQVDQMLADQGGVCKLCERVPKRACVDHCHNTGKVRGILCHGCNIRLGGWDDRDWRARALHYLGINNQSTREGINE